MTSASLAPAAPSDLARLQVAVTKLRHRIAELEVFRPDEIENRNDPGIARLAKAVDDTLLEVFGADSEAYKQLSVAKAIDTAPYMLGGTPIGLVRHGLEQGKAMAIALLQQAAASLEEKIGGRAIAPSPQPLAKFPASEPPAPASAPAAAPAPPPPPVHVPTPVAAKPPPASPAPAAAPPAAPITAVVTGVVVAYAAGDAAGEEIARFLAKAELGAVARYESAAGPADIEALERQAGIGFAVVLLPSGDGMSGREKALAELCYFLGKLGRRKVCVLARGAAESLPVAGIVCAPFDPYEGWQKVVLRALEGGGYRIDWGKALR